MTDVHPLAIALALTSSLTLFWLASRRWPPLFLLAAAYLTMVLPASARTLPMTAEFKLLRVGVLCLILVIGVVMRRPARFGLPVWIFLLPLSFYAAAGLWSARPEAAVTNKGLALVTALAGILTARSSPPGSPPHQPFRLLLVGAIVSLSQLGLYLVLFPTQVTRLGRLMPFSINPNILGMAMANLLILCMAAALLDVSRTARTAAYAAALCAGLVLLQSGSRGAVVQGLVGCSVLAATFAKRPRQLIAGMAILAVSGLGFAYVADSPAIERMVTLDTPSRANIWNHAMKLFAENPVFGSGWHYNVRGLNSYATRNLHNVYIQLLVEAGVVGLALFAASLSALIVQAFRLRQFARLRRLPDPSAGVALALLLSTAVHGLVEAAPVMGTIDCFMFGFAVGLVDRAGTARALITAAPGWRLGAASSGQSQLGSATSRVASTTLR